MFKKKNFDIEHQQKITRARQHIKKLVKFSAKDSNSEDLSQEFNSDKYIPVLGADNVISRVCSLDDHTRDSLTIINCVFSKGGFIPEHTHEQVEIIFVIDGQIKNVLTGEVFKEGDRVIIPAFEPHSFSSDYALLSITWRPAFDTTEEVAYLGN